jgi:ATP-dependent Lon protease
LGDGDNKSEEMRDMREKIELAKMPGEVEEEAIKQLKRLKTCIQMQLKLRSFALTLNG